MVHKEGLRTDNANSLNKQCKSDNYSKFCPLHQKTISQLLGNYYYFCKKYFYIKK